MAILQVKGMDNQLYAVLKRRAALDHRSVSQEVILIIQDYLSQPVKENQNATHEFLKLSGAWAGSESAEKLIGDIYKSRQRSKKNSFIKNVFN